MLVNLQRSVFNPPTVWTHICRTIWFNTQFHIPAFLKETWHQGSVKIYSLGVWPRLYFWLDCFFCGTMNIILQDCTFSPQAWNINIDQVRDYPHLRAWVEGPPYHLLRSACVQCHLLPTGLHSSSSPGWEVDNFWAPILVHRSLKDLMHSWASSAWQHLLLEQWREMALQWNFHLLCCEEQFGLTQ